MRETKVMVRLSEEEKELLESVAHGNSLAVASWARMELLRRARQLTAERAVEVEADDAPALLSLFCGPGGLDEGFRQAGFRTAVAIDVYEPAVETFRFNHRQAKCAVRDITQTRLNDLDELLGRQLEPVGVLGGPPCQSFSVSNVHQRDSDPRHRLPEAYARLLAALNDRHAISFFVFENVPGLLGPRHIHRYNQFKELFREAGFEIHEALLNAKQYGVPQDRPRIFIVGINTQLHPGATWTPPAPEKHEIPVSAVLRGLPDPVFNSRGMNPEEIPFHRNHWCFVPRSNKFKAGLKEGEMWGRSFRTLVWDQPSWTVAYGHREVHVHPSGQRRLSIYEAMRLQSFPHEYRLMGTISDQCTLVSEAVPPELARRIAVSIREALGI